MLAIYIDAGNDKNGNPRRGWLIAASDGVITGFVDEGYAGRGALREACGNIPSTDEAIPVPASFYRRARKSSRGG
jgi:hypothetical protein